MFAAVDIVYVYDGTFDGLMCCVFASYTERERPLDIIGAEQQPPLWETKTIVTDDDDARRVRDSIPRKMGRPALDFIRKIFLTNLEHKELCILRLLYRGYARGASVMNDITDPLIDKLLKAVLYLERESHMYKGFVRFGDYDGSLVATIEPRNIVLPLLSAHFCARFPNERFLIHDKTHGMALLYESGCPAIIPLAELILPSPDARERRYRGLWQTFYTAIAIKERHNPRCRMNMMPKRYWAYMTEFAGAVANDPPPLAARSAMLAIGNGNGDGGYE